jgi:murein DD-endopeptidase / murein LD-carboxypeptidase
MKIASLGGSILKTHSRHYRLIICFCLILISCASQPRFRSEPVEKKVTITVPEEETRNTEETQSFGDEGKSGVDLEKMGNIIDSYLGVPYKLGGETRTGMDCSGLVVAVYRQYKGFKLPHDTQKLFKLVKRVDKEDLSYGDLVFFSDGYFGVSHVGIYLGGGKFVHTSQELGVVVSSLDEDYFSKRYAGARRVIP